MNTLLNNTYTYGVAEQKLTEADILRASKLLSNDNEGSIKEIAFSDKESRIKELHYKAFKQLPKAKGTVGFCSIPIVEDTRIRSDMMILRCSNPDNDRAFMLVDDNKLVELRRIKPQFKFSL